jgi:hypothetical protein
MGQVIEHLRRKLKALTSKPQYQQKKTVLLYSSVGGSSLQRSLPWFSWIQAHHLGPTSTPGSLCATIHITASTLGSGTLGLKIASPHYTHIWWRLRELSLSSF